MSVGIPLHHEVRRLFRASHPSDYQDMPFLTFLNWDIFPKYENGRCGGVDLHALMTSVDVDVVIFLQ